MNRTNTAENWVSTARHDVPDASSIEIWDRLQELQSDFCIGFELPSYYHSPRWRDADRVLDVGTGNGYHLRKIADHFPEKSYTGVDLSSEVIEVARRNNTYANLGFESGDFFDIDGSYDYVVMRLILQHIDADRMAETLTKLAHLTHAGGTVMVVDADDSARFFEPQVPEFMDFFHAYTRHQQERDLDRAVAENLPRFVETHPEWSIGSTHNLVIPSTTPGNLELFRTTYRMVIDLVEQTTDLSHDFPRVKQAWDRWCAESPAYTQVGLRMIELHRQ